MRGEIWWNLGLLLTEGIVKEILERMVPVALEEGQPSGSDHILKVSVEFLRMERPIHKI